MFDDTMDPRDGGMLELTRRLEAYADVRLSPSLTSTARMRGSVMNAAHRRMSLIAAETARAAIDVSAETRDPKPTRATLGRWARPAAAFMTASLALALVTGTAYAAKAGGPLYAARLWIEEANLPFGLLARAQAEGVRLDVRIAEAQQASIDGDAPAAEAALAAYSVIVAEAGRGTAGDTTAIAAIELSVSRHAVVLDELAGTVPEHARGAVQKALVSGSEVIRELGGRSTQGTGSHPSGTGSSGGGGPVDPRASDPPTPFDRPLPDTGGGVVAPPADPQPTPKASGGRDHEAPPPGQSRGGGPAHTNQPAKPSATPKAQSGGSSSQAERGGPSAP